MSKCASNQRESKIMAVDICYLLYKHGRQRGGKEDKRGERDEASSQLSIEKGM